MSDLMLQAVLRMPPELWGSGAWDAKQRHSRYVQAADELEALRAALDQQANEHQSHVEELEASIHIASREREESRAALDQERADNERLRSIAHAADVFVRVEDSTARTMREWQLAFDLLRTALLSGRGETTDE